VDNYPAVKRKVVSGFVTQGQVLLTMLSLGPLGVFGQTADYHIISQRNAFGLKPAPPLATVPAISPGRRSQITITGITTIFGDKRVLLKSLPPPGNPGDPPPLEESFILAEGQTNADLIIVRVDPMANTVTLKNAGVVEVLKLREPGKPSFGPPPPPAALPIPVNAFAYH
jgi:hypothetical protein